MSRHVSAKWGLWLLVACICASAILPAAPARAQCGGFTVTTDRCLLICPQSDVVFKVTVIDAGGNAVCLPAGSIYLDFAGCGAIPCPGEEPNWPLVYPDSCNPATGEHYFTVDAGISGCTLCQVPLVVNGAFCQTLIPYFFDTNGDLCVTATDFVGGICNDYDCDGAITAADQAIFNAHLGHCCPQQPCVPGGAFCDSVRTDPCLLICPKSDEVFKVAVKDSCGNPLCVPAGSMFLDFAGCPAAPCPGEEPNWPLVFPDSCDPATGVHYFTVDAGAQDCVDCAVPLVIDGAICKTLTAHFFDVNGDLCVTPTDFVGGPCNDYNCDGTVDAVDAGIFNGHLDHCCPSGPCPPGRPFCDSVTTDKCLLICPLSDEVFKVQVKDSCGNPICGFGAAPSVWLDFSHCPAEPCPNEEPNWPIVYPDSCNPATGIHYFTVDASLLQCVNCDADLFVNGVFCRSISTAWLDIDGDHCVTNTDFVAGAVCTDLDCDGIPGTAADFAIHTAHLGHCCPGGPCPPGPAFCDSVKTDPCVLVCPHSDEVFRVIAKDSCGNPVCNPPVIAPAVWLDFSTCPAHPCGNEEPNWPIVYPDSCDAATGVHYFTVDASLLDCTDCNAVLFVNGKACRNIPAKFFDVNGDGCVKPNDFVGALCNDYDCDGVITANDQNIFKSHLCHCCDGQCIIAVTGDVNGDNLVTSADIIWMVNHIFKGGAPPMPCPAAGDVNCDGVLNSADIIVLVNFVFKSGPPPCNVCTIIPAKWMCCPY
jgi:hypothetical protein